MFLRSKKCSYWPLLLAILMIVISCGILFGGTNEMIKYGKATGNKINYNLVSLHFFVREYLEQQYQKITVKDLPENSALPSFHLYADEKDLSSLEENLPSSGKLQFKPGHIKIDKPEFSGETQFRYRGGLDLHWLYKKKSIRVKLPPFSNYRNERSFNLVNPSTIYTITDWVSYDMARSIGLLTPEYFPARVFINNETNGLHYFLSEIDESFLRKNNRMPGSIYTGDSIYFVNPYVNKSPINEVSFGVEDGVPRLWKDGRLWKKDASRNSESADNREDINVFIKTINEISPLAFMQAFDTYFDKEKFYLFFSLDNLVGSYHHDLYHNHKIYFDPYKGKFEPIEWDLRFWSHVILMPVIPLHKQVLLNPILKYELDSTLYKLWNKFSVQDVVDKIDSASNTVAAELAADPYRQNPDLNNKHFVGFDKVGPFSMNEYDDAIKDLKQTYKIRHSNTELLLNISYAEYSVEKVSDNQVQVLFSANGISPVKFDPWSMVPEISRETTQIFRVYKDKKYPVLKNERSEILYPGITISELGNSNIKSSEIMYPGITISESGNENKSGQEKILMYSPDRYSTSPLYYQYLIKGINSSDLLNSKKIMGENAITSKEIIIKHVDDFSDSNNTPIFHPWELLAQVNTAKNKVILSGEIDVSQDLVFSEEQIVTIEPGTVFKISKNSSIFFYGKVIVKGRADAPVKFEAKEPGQAWGSIVIQGKKASGSALSYVEIDGGSIASRNLIHYSGQINIHNVDSFQLEYCHISNNSIGDDALHIAYSQGEIKHCDFKNTAFDALDMDIVDVTVTDSTFNDAGNDAIDLMNSKTLISNVDIDGAGDKCVSVGEASNVTIKDSQLKNCQIGIAVKDESITHVEDVDFSIDQGKAISLYRKNSRYSSGGEISGDRLYGITPEDITVGDYSINKIQKDAYLPSRVQ